MFCYCTQNLYFLLLCKLPDVLKHTLNFNAIYYSPGPGPSSNVYDNNALPELPSVPDTLPASSFGGNTTTSDDIDFDDLTRRFEELKKKT